MPMTDSAKPWTLAAGQNPPLHDSSKPWAMPMVVAAPSPNDSSRHKDKPGSAGT
jgi:hypothetical protein